LTGDDVDTSSTATDSATNVSILSNTYVAQQQQLGGLWRERLLWVRHCYHHH
jgi:hypothetical protein